MKIHSEASRFSMVFQVRSYEMDSFGHVNNAIYLHYLEYARSEYLVQRGLSFNDFKKWSAVPYVVRVEIDYKASARVHDTLEILGWIPEWGRSSFVMEHEIWNRTQQCLAARARIKFAFVNGDEKIISIPKEFAEMMR